MKVTRILPLLLAMPIGQACADTPIQLSHPASASAQINVSNVKGEVTITAWDRNELQVGGRLGDGAQPLAITGTDDKLTVAVQAQGKGGWFNWGSDNQMGPSVLELHVPKSASLKVEVVSAPVGIDGTDGGTIALDTVSGKLRINSRTPMLTANSVSGSIEVAGHADNANLQTVSGDILAPSIGYHAELQTVSGRIHVNGGPWQRLTLSTVSGDVQVGGNLVAGGTLGIDSMSGDVQLQLPSTLSSTIHASTFSGDLRSDFGQPNKAEHGPGSELQTTVGDGKAKIRVETFSGDLRIRKQD